MVRATMPAAAKPAAAKPPAPAADPQEGAPSEQQPDASPLQPEAAAEDPAQVEKVAETVEAALGTKLGEQPKPLDPAEALKPGETTVTMIFPRDVTLNLGSGEKVKFKKGVREVPEHLSTHYYLRDNGVTPHVR